ncbi:MAG: DivIVA domain-containing protein [bacterium]|jgi:cell division initiation protein
MPLTPLDIEKKEFKRALRGYSEDEVDDFLDLVIKDFEVLYRENIELKEQIQYLREQLEQYERLEETLKSTLVLAQQTAEEVKINAQREGELMLREAREKAAQIAAEAERSVQDIIDRRRQATQELRVFYSKVKALVDTQVKILADLDQELT